VQTETPKESSGRQFLNLMWDPTWFPEGSERRIFVRYYSIVGQVQDQLDPAHRSVKEFNLTGHSFRVALVKISGQKYKSHHPWLISSDDGVVKVEVELLDRTLPTSLYVVVSTPVAPGAIDPDSMARRMDHFASLSRCVAGNNFLWTLAREAFVDVASGNMVTPSEIVKLPQPLDGPFLKGYFEELTALLSALTNHPPVALKRVSLALELFERGFQERAGSKFFYYWVASEVLCDSHRSARILANLVAAYGTTRGYVQNDLGFDLIKAIRVDTLHRGNPHDLPQDVERYIQSMFMDLLRHELKLSCSRYMEKQIAAGFDVDRLNKDVGRHNVLLLEEPKLN
jgi:hypothetical protein